MCLVANQSPPKGDKGSIPLPTSIYWFAYRDRIKHLHFETKQDAAWYAHNEGDVLLNWGEI